MTSRALPLVNAIGCLALTGLVLAQWLKERSMREELAQSKARLSLSLQQTDEETKRSAALERDITLLKETLESAQKAALTATDDIVSKDRAIAQLQAELSAAREQITTWEAALKTRDEQIRALDSNLAATRKRLEEAIQALKAAGAK
jgi:chromosome segregation ATPase